MIYSLLMLVIMVVVPWIELIKNRILPGTDRTIRKLEKFQLANNYYYDLHTTSFRTITIFYCIFNFISITDHLTCFYLIVIVSYISCITVKYYDN